MRESDEIVREGGACERKKKVWERKERVRRRRKCWTGKESVGVGRRDRLFPDTASVSASIHQLYQNNCQGAEFIVLNQ